jgi:hypothetical protein
MVPSSLCLCVILALWASYSMDSVGAVRLVSPFSGFKSLHSQRGQQGNGVKISTFKPITMLGTSTSASKSSNNTFDTSFIASPIASIQKKWKKMRNAKSFPHFVAGMVAGSLECFVGHPLDTIRVIAMTTSNMDVVHRSNTLYSALRSCFTPRGFMNIYRGSSSEMLSSGVAGAMIFGVNDILRRVFNKTCDDDDVTKVDRSILLSAGITGFVDGWASKPFEIVKLRQQVEPTHSTPSTFFESYNALYNEGGVGVFFRGWLPTVLRETIGNIAYFAAYHQTKIFLQHLASRRRQQREQLLKTHNVKTAKSPLELRNSTIVLIAGAAAGFAYCVSSQPLEMASILMQADMPTRTIVPGCTNPLYTYKYTSMSQCFRTMIAEEGYGSLFKGIVPTVLRALPTHAAALYGYETTLDLIHTYDRSKKNNKAALSLVNQNVTPSRL